MGGWRRQSGDGILQAAAFVAFMLTLSPLLAVLRGKSRVNAVVLSLIYSDFLTISAAGLFEPIFAVYLTNHIGGGSLAVAGFATTVFWVTKSIAQVPISWYVDKIKGERDDFYFLVVGAVLTSFVPLLYYFFAREVWHIYILQAINGIGYAMQVPTWLAIFTRHIDRNLESTEWMIHSNAIGLGVAVAAGFGGAFADRYGIRALFPLVSVLMFLGAGILVVTRRKLFPSDVAGAK